MTGGGGRPGSGSLPPPGFPPAAGEVHVWILDVSAPWMEGLADEPVVSSAERARADRMTRAGLSRDLLARRTALRHVLGRYLGRPAGEVEIVAAPGGKPVLLPSRASDGPAGGIAGAGGAPDDRVRAPDGGSGAPTLPFSVAHSGDLYGVAVASVGSVGLDLEERRDVPRAAAIARRWFGDGEAEALTGLEGPERERAFLRLWTGKEALAKRHGAGLRLMMRGDVAELDTVAAEAEGRLRCFSPRPECHAAVAGDAAISIVRTVEPEDGAWIG